jgi:hypothetical protein
MWLAVARGGFDVGCAVRNIRCIAVSFFIDLLVASLLPRAQNRTMARVGWIELDDRPEGNFDHGWRMGGRESQLR